MEHILKKRLIEVIEFTDDKIEEFASAILGFQETLAHDIIYEEVIDALNKIKNKVDVIIEIITTNESIQKKDK